VTFIVIASLLAIGQSLAAYWFSDKLALAVSGARPATKDEHRYLVNVTEAVAIGAGVPTPRLYVIDSPAPNAFATGRDPQHGAIAVTKGLMELLDRQELEGVVAHEMAHVKNYDIRFASMLAATVGAIVLLRDVILRGMRFGGRSRRSSSSGGGKGQAIAMMLLIVLLVLAPLLATLLRWPSAADASTWPTPPAPTSPATRTAWRAPGQAARLPGRADEGERGRAAHVLHQPGGEAERADVAGDAPADRRPHLAPAPDVSRPGAA
jgi:hypothetical protein